MLRILEVGLSARHLRIDVAVRHEQVEPSVVVHIEEANTPAEQARIHPETAGISAVFKARIAEVGVERISVARKVGLDDIERSVPVVVSDGDAHTCLRLSLSGKRGAALDGNIAERPVHLVQVERRRRRIVSDVNIRPAVVVQVRRRNAETVGAHGGPHAGFLAHIGEGSVTVVVVQDVASAGQAGWSARDQDPLVSAGTVFRLGSRRQIEINIVRDEEIQMTVLVIVDKATAGVPADLGPGLDKSGLLRDISKCTVPVVAVKNVLAVISHKEIIMAVVVVVAYAASLPPAGLVFEAGAGGNIGKRAIPVVLEEMTARFLPGRESPQASSH